MEDIVKMGAEKPPECPARRPEGWKEVLAYTFAQFILNKPKDAIDALQRIAIVSLLVFLSGGSYIIFRHPEAVRILNPTPVEERTIVERLAEDSTRKNRVFDELEAWFYAHRPHGLMLVSWEELSTLNGIWVSPPDKLKSKVGVHELTPNIRSMAGPFVFGECVDLASEIIEGKRMAACPIVTSYDVWGYVAVVYDPSELKEDYIMRDLRILAHRLTGIIY